jgi:hypothetical protein
VFFIGAGNWLVADCHHVFYHYEEPLYFGSIVLGGRMSVHQVVSVLPRRPCVLEGLLHMKVTAVAFIQAPTNTTLSRFGAIFAWDVQQPDNNNSVRPW